MLTEKELWIASRDNKIEVVEAPSLDEASKLVPKANTFQRMEVYKHMKYNGTVIGYLYFQFVNGNFVVVNDHGTKILKIEKNREFVYKFMKTKVKAIDGQAGLMNYIYEVKDDHDHPLNQYTYQVLNKIGS